MINDMHLQCITIVNCERSAFLITYYNVLRKAVYIRTKNPIRNITYNLLFLIIPKHLRRYLLFGFRISLLRFLLCFFFF